MWYRVISGIIAVVAILVLATPAYAGGWAVVTVDAVPAEPPAGQPIEIGFMVRQHGVTPINDVSTTLIATNKVTGEKVQASGKQSGAKGHFVVKVTFPGAGTWEWEIIPAPFEGTKLGTLQVGVVKPIVPTSAPASTSVATTQTAVAPDILRWLGAGLLVVAVILAIIGWQSGRKWQAVTRQGSNANVKS
jgi:hypothetical protein